MSSGLKTGLAIALLLAGVFAITVISQLSPSGKKSKDDKGDVAPEIAPLVCTVTEYQYDPQAEDLYWYNRLVNGFLEVGTGGADSVRRNWVGYVLSNRRNEPVYLSYVPSCPRCSSARAKTVSHEAMQAYFAEAALGGFVGIGGVPNPLAAVAWAQRTLASEWFTFDFAQPARMYEVPAAKGMYEPVWVLLELDFKIFTEAAPSPAKVTFEILNADKKKLLPLELKVTYAAREPFEIWPRQIAAGDFPEGVEPRTFEVTAFSMTRSRGEFSAPTAAVNGDDPTVAISTPHPLSDDECARLAIMLTREMHATVRVLSAYRYTVTLHRQLPGKTPEVGEFEKEVHFANNALMPRTYRIGFKGQITGAVSIDGAGKLELGTYESANRTKREFQLVSEKPEVELELVPERCKPEFVKLTLGEPQVAFGRKVWTLTATIEERQGRVSNWNGAAVVRTKSPNPQVFVFKMSGYGR